MQAVRRAIIDVGTNSIKLLVAEVAGRDVQPVLEESRQTRLGHGFYRTHRLQPGPIAQTAQAVAEFAAKAGELRALSIRIIATSAAREALNRKELTSAIEVACALPVEVISGEKEADYAFQGVTTDPALACDSLLLLDVGGGSTEFILGQGAQTHFRRSFPLGTVRLLEQLPPADPPTPGELAGCRAWVRRFLEQELSTTLMPALRREKAAQSSPGTVQLVGTGGTASILGCIEAGLDHFDRQLLEATVLSREKLHEHVERLWQIPIAERRRMAGLPANRADVILTGAAIYEAVIEHLDFRQLRISTRGLRFAALMDYT